MVVEGLSTGYLRLVWLVIILVRLVVVYYMVYFWLGLRLWVAVLMVEVMEWYLFMVGAILSLARLWVRLGASS